MSKGPELEWLSREARSSVGCVTLRLDTGEVSLPSTCAPPGSCMVSSWHECWILQVSGPGPACSGIPKMFLLQQGALGSTQSCLASGRLPETGVPVFPSHLCGLAAGPQLSVPSRGPVLPGVLPNQCLDHMHSDSSGAAERGPAPCPAGPCPSPGPCCSTFSRRRLDRASSTFPVVNFGLVAIQPRPGLCSLFHGLGHHSGVPCSGACPLWSVCCACTLLAGPLLL